MEVSKRHRAVRGGVSVSSALVATLLTLFCGFGAEGVVIYKGHPDNPDNLAIVVEYSEIKNFGRVTNIIPADGGDMIRTTGSNIVEAVEYIDLSDGTYTTPQRLAELKAKPQALGALAKRFPRARTLLADEARRINAAVKLLEESKALVSGQGKGKEAMGGASPNSGETLTLVSEGGQGRTYTGVRVTGQEPDALQIMHSGGAATIPFEQLSEADQKKYGFDPVKAEEHRKQKAMAMAAAAASQPDAGSGAAPSAQDGMSEEELIAQFQAQYPDKDYVHIYNMARDVITSRKKAEHDAKMAAAYPSYAKLIEGIEDGVSTRPFDVDSFDHIRKLIVEEAPSSGKQAVLEKEKLYSVLDVYGTMKIGQRLDNLLIAENVDGIPFALIRVPEPSLLDGVRFPDSPLFHCIGIYEGDHQMTTVSGSAKTFPVFEAHLIMGPSPTGAELVMIRFSGSSEDASINSNNEEHLQLVKTAPPIVPVEEDGGAKGSVTAQIEPSVAEAASEGPSSIIDDVVSEMTAETFDYTPEKMHSIAGQLAAVEAQFPRNKTFVEFSQAVASLASALKLKEAAKKQIQNAETAREEAMTRVRAAYTQNTSNGLQVEEAERDLKAATDRLNAAREASPKVGETKTKVESMVRSFQQEKADAEQRLAGAAAQRAREVERERFVQEKDAQSMGRLDREKPGQSKLPLTSIENFIHEWGDSADLTLPDVESFATRLAAGVSQFPADSSLEAIARAVGEYVEAVTFKKSKRSAVIEAERDIARLQMRLQFSGDVSDALAKIQLKKKNETLNDAIKSEIEAYNQALKAGAKIDEVIENFRKGKIK